MTEPDWHLASFFSDKFTPRPHSAEGLNAAGELTSGQCKAASVQPQAASTGTTLQSQCTDWQPCDGSGMNAAGITDPLMKGVLMPAPSFELSAAHRWFAIECNNHAWEWLETGERTPEAALAAIHLTHASCYHWGQVGTTIHQARAAYLLTDVYALAGWGDAALRLATVAAELLTAAGTDAADWDRAFVSDASARAAVAAGQLEHAHRLRAEAAVLGEQIADSEDRQVFVAWFARHWPLG